MIGIVLGHFARTVGSLNAFCELMSGGVIELSIMCSFSTIYMSF